MDFLRGKMESAKETVSTEFDALKNKLEEQANQFAAEKRAMLDKWKEEKRKLILTFIQTQVEGLFDHGMNVAGETLKEKIKDPYMPQFVKNLCDDMVDGIWPDVKIELKDEILKGFSEPMKISHGEANCPCSPLAFFRYSLLPYDRGFWRQIRNPVWWLFNLLSLVPKYGVMQIVYILNFFMIDKGDEFQLFQFIVQFKALQFLSIGIIGSVLGSVQYYFCVSANPPNCDKHSPRESFWTMVLFFLQVVVILIAFLMMNCSEKKGGFYYQLEEDAQRKVQASAGSRTGRLNALDEFSRANDEMDETTRIMHTLRYKSDADMLESSKGRLIKFLIYDFLIFLICVGLILFLAFYNVLDQDATVTKSDDNVGDGNWKFVMSLFWIKCFYGYMSFPFVVLKLPLISSLISHARPTGYNRYGKTVPYIGQEEDGPVPWDPERPPKIKDV